MARANQHDESSSGFDCMFDFGRKDTQSADSNRMEKVRASVSPPFSGTVVLQDLSLPEGKSWRVSINMINLQ